MLPLCCFAAFSGWGIGKEGVAAGLILRTIANFAYRPGASVTFWHTRIQKKAVSTNLRLACVLIARPFCLLTPDVNAHISRSALSLRYCVSEAEYSSEVFPLSVFISGALTQLCVIGALLQVIRSLTIQKMFAFTHYKCFCIQKIHFEVIKLEHWAALLLATDFHILTRFPINSTIAHFSWLWMFWLLQKNSICFYSFSMKLHFLPDIYERTY